MFVMTRKTLAKTAMNRWRLQYAKAIRENQGMLYGIWRRLEALGNDPSPESVDAAIGVKSWTKVPRCDECKREVNAVVEVGDLADYESSTARICIDCLRRAVSECEEVLRIEPRPTNGGEQTA